MQGSGDTEKSRRPWRPSRGHFADIEIGLADASIAVLAERHACDTVLTLDERHFRVLRVKGKPFRLLPSDA